MKLYHLFSIALLLMCLNLTHTYAQSTDVNNPTVLTEEQLTVNAVNEIQNYYYTFNALVGEMKLTGDGLGNYALFTVSFQDEDLNTLKSFNFNSNTPLKRTIAKMTFVKNQKIILKIRASKNINASLVLRLEGVSFNANQIQTSQTGSTPSSPNISTSGIPAETTPAINAGQTPTPTGDNSGETMKTTGDVAVQPASLEGSRRVIVVLKNGQILEGTHTGYNLITGFGNKISLTVRGKDLPKFNAEDVKSITVE